MRGYAFNRVTGLCTRCEQGSYQPSVGRSPQCTDCPPTLTTTRDGATDVAECTCDEGQYFNRETERCVTCREGDGHNCTGGKELPLVLSGYWGSPISERDEAAFTGYEIYQCEPIGACPGGQADTCAANREGLACGVCKRGYVDAQNTGPCTECNTTKGYTTPLLFLFGVTLLCGAFYVAINSQFTARTTVTSIVSLSLGLTLNFIQQLGVAYNSYAVQWPLSFSAYFQYLNVFLLDFSFIRISCIGVNTFERRYVFELASPFILLAIFFVYWLLSYAVHLLVRNVNAPRVRLLRVLKDGTPLDMDKLFSTIGVIISAAYIALARIALSLFTCRKHPSGQWTIKAFPEVLCRGNRFASVLPFGVSAIILYPIGILLWFGGVCIRAPYRFDDVRFRTRYKFLLYRFTPDKYWWGVVILARNMLLTLAAVIFPSDGYAQVYYTAAVLIVSVVMQVYHMPFRDPRNNYLDMILTMITLFIIVVGVFFIDSQDRKPEAYAIVLTVSVTLPCLPCW
ncbi:unnamed protein product [Vitrella brassicaformis CCMP3155]|uniref:Tyrosine-protein kinase ephrin type A/B receptor-like domain-containing protein n=1 Tax=Vitrella brassicaformis (strain CCMP3155) TaxID=1169540 RepID=A0A0G4GTE6_VITBC|nr:unnamed protein product [Vitrella brassicaformis CCMP3155]|eukprot:CEM34047.1 unnamed protein product [Vitrella brassicaformis CCMP3155]